MQKSIARNFLFKFILNLFNIAVPILVGPYLARKLGPETMGTFNYAQTVFTYFFIFASFGVYQYGLREVSNARNNKEKFESVFTNIFLISIITNLTTLIIYYIFIYYSNYTDLYIPCMILSFNFLSNIFYVEWVNESLENYDFISIKTIIVKLIYVFLIFIFVKNSNSLNQYMILLGATTFINNIVSYIYIKKYSKFNFKYLNLKKHIKPMFMVVILSNVTVLYTQLDKLMIGRYLDMQSVAFYTIAQLISTMIAGLMLTFINVTIPRLSNYSANCESDKYRELLNKVTKIYFMLLFPTCIGMLVLSKQIILLYGGMEYTGAITVFSIFSIYVITLGYESILKNQIMYVKCKERELVIIAFIGGVANLIMNIVLLKLDILNPSTAIFTTMISNIINILLQYYYIKRNINLDFKIFTLDKSKYLFISLIFIPITIIIKSFNYNIIMTCLLTIIGNSIVYFAILYIIKDEVFIECMNFIKNKFNIR